MDHHENEKPNSKSMRGSDQNSLLSSASHLTRSELLKRRLNNLKRLSKCYRGLYWALMDHVRTLYAHYLWDSGLSPFNNDNCSSSSTRSNCAHIGCEFKAMPLTTFCRLHILSDPNQKLYKPCNSVIKSAQGGPIRCRKPILRSMVPSLCSVHFEKAQKHLTRSLKSHFPSTTKVPPKFHVILTEYVRQIQAKRRELRAGKQEHCVVAQNRNDI